MTHQKQTIFFSLIVILPIALSLIFVPRAFTGSYLLPHVSSNMEDPQFWIRKIQNPSLLLLTPGEIRKMNEENLNREDLLLARIKDLKEDCGRDEISALLKEDWGNFGRTEEVRYGRNGYPLGEFFWSELKKNLNQESLKDRNQMLFGLIVKRTDLRVFPTDEISMSTPANYEFDRFQHSSLSPGTPIGIYHLSKDSIWAYAQTPFIRGWVRLTDFATATKKSEVSDYEEEKDRLVITGSFVKIFEDPLFQDPVFISQMGTSFPLLDLPGSSGMAGQYYLIRIPFREIDGQLTFRKGYIPWNEDVHRGFLPYTQKNMAYQAFKMLHQPYGWGEMFGARDCSRFMMDLFSTFGILMPRNSKLQARVGISLGQLEGKTIKEKKKILDRAIPLATTLRLPGHIMLYLGKEDAKYYVIHNIWGIQRAVWFGPSVEKIGRTVVSDLSLGKSGPKASLLDRTTDIQFIGSDLEVKKRIP
jgi:hypothetical protein